MALEAAVLLIQAANSGKPAAALTHFFLEDLGACYASLAILLPNSTTFALLGNLSSCGRCDMVLLRNTQTIGQYLGQEQPAVDMQHACGEGRQTTEGNLQRAWDGGARSTLVCVPLPPFIPGSAARGVLSVGWSLPMETSQLERHMTRIGEMTDALAKMSANPSLQHYAPQPHLPMGYPQAPAAYPPPQNHGVPGHPSAVNSHAQPHLPASFPLRENARAHPGDDELGSEASTPLRNSFSCSSASSYESSESETDASALSAAHDGTTDMTNATNSDSEGSRLDAPWRGVSTPAKADTVRFNTDAGIWRGALTESETDTSTLSGSRRGDGDRSLALESEADMIVGLEKIPYAAVQEVIRRHGRDCKHRRGGSTAVSINKRVCKLAKARAVKSHPLQPHSLKAAPILPYKAKGLSLPASLLLLACCGLLASPVVQLILNKSSACL